MNWIKNTRNFYQNRIKPKHNEFDLFRLFLKKNKEKKVVRNLLALLVTCLEQCLIAFPDKNTYIYMYIVHTISFVGALSKTGSWTAIGSAHLIPISTSTWYIHCIVREMISEDLNIVLLTFQQLVYSMSREHHRSRRIDEKHHK